jgi:hypothetical protein
VNEPDGRIGAFCIYEAKDGASIREHGARVGMPGNEFYPVQAGECPLPLRMLRCNRNHGSSSNQPRQIGVKNAAHAKGGFVR